MTAEWDLKRGWIRAIYGLWRRLEKRRKMVTVKYRMKIICILFFPLRVWDLTLLDCESSIMLSWRFAVHKDLTSFIFICSSDLQHGPLLTQGLHAPLHYVPVGFFSSYVLSFWHPNCLIWKMDSTSLIASARIDIWKQTNKTNKSKLKLKLVSALRDLNPNPSISLKALSHVRIIITFFFSKPLGPGLTFNRCQWGEC